MSQIISRLILFLSLIAFSGCGDDDNDSGSDSDSDSDGDSDSDSDGDSDSDTDSDSDGDSDSDLECDGAEVGGFCWYLGESMETCSEVCAEHGGYNEATKTFAGSEGTDENCEQVLDVLEAGEGTVTPVWDYPDPAGYGCHYYKQFDGVNARYRDAKETTADGIPNDNDQYDYYRACACDN